MKEKAKKIKNSPIKLGHSHGHNHDHDVYEEEYGKQESEWHEYTHDGVSGQPVSLCHSGEANFRHRRRSFHQEQKISDWYRWIIPNVLNLSPYEILFIYILWRWTWEQKHRVILLNCTTCWWENRESRLIRLAIKHACVFVIRNKDVMRTSGGPRT